MRDWWLCGVFRALNYGREGERMEDKPSVCFALSAEALEGRMWKKLDETNITFPELEVF